MNKDLLLLGAMTTWIFFLVTVGMFIVGYADILAYGAIAWCAGAVMFVQGIKMAIRG